MALTVVFETGSIFFDGGDDGDSCVCLAERSSSDERKRVCSWRGHIVGSIG